jgi:hypothetical protein
MGGRQYRASAEPRAVEPQTNAVPPFSQHAGAIDPTISHSRQAN